jgi:hypothetical protein
MLLLIGIVEFFGGVLIWFLVVLICIACISLAGPHPLVFTSRSAYGLPLRVTSETERSMSMTFRNIVIFDTSPEVEAKFLTGNFLMDIVVYYRLVINCLGVERHIRADHAINVIFAPLRMLIDLLRGFSVSDLGAIPPVNLKCWSFACVEESHGCNSYCAVIGESPRSPIREYPSPFIYDGSILHNTQLTISDTGIYARGSHSQESHYYTYGADYVKPVSLIKLVFALSVLVGISFFVIGVRLNAYGIDHTIFSTQMAGWWLMVLGGILTLGRLLMFFAQWVVPSSSNNVTHKYRLTSSNYCITVMCIGRTQMASVLNTEKQVAIIGGLAEGSSVM